MTSKVMTVVGARPQFVKAAVVSHAIADRSLFDEVLIHTGQHYDANMSQDFFDELGIPNPKVNLGISGGTHAEMTAAMLVALENAVKEEEPDALLLYGDTNSTLSAALVAAKLHVPIVHVEAGARTRSMTNPEEINRICTDHVSSVLLACTKENLSNLRTEGLSGRSRYVGDPMLDAFLAYRKTARMPHLVSVVDGATLALPEKYYYLTCHREENTASDDVLAGILESAGLLDAPVVYPVHPRVRRRVASLMEGRGLKNLLPVDPVGYLESIYLTCNARQIVTDSGGLQREAFFAEVKCTTLLDFEVWPETMVDGRNVLAKPEANSIIAAMEVPQSIDPAYRPFGEGDAAYKIVNATEELLEGL